MRIRSITILILYFTSAVAQELVVINEPAPGNAYRMGSEYTLHCQGILGSGCLIRWTENGETMEYTSDTIQVTVRPGSVSYRCSFVCRSGADVRQSDVKILSGQNLIRVEILNSGVSGTDWRPLENSIMELTCTFGMLSSEITKGIEEEIKPTFQWMVNGDVMGAQETFTFVALPGYNKSIQCKAEYQGEELTSAGALVQATDEPEEPQVVFMRQDNVVDSSLFVTGADYTAYCVSKSHSAGATYIWTKDYFTIPNTPASRTLILDSANGDSDDGVYRCRMRLQESEYCSRTSVAMQVQQAGRFCQSDSDCLAGNQYTQSCKSNRCECASGFSPRGDVCAGMTPLLASSFLVVCAMIFSYLF